MFQTGPSPQFQISKPSFSLGSVCSRNLCDLYLGKLENSLFYYADSSSLQIESLFAKTSASRMQLCRANEIILRVVDDYLVVGADLGEALCYFFQVRV
jgi:hypothetical protein